MTNDDLENELNQIKINLEKVGSNLAETKANLTQGAVMTEIFKCTWCGFSHSASYDCRQFGDGTMKGESENGERGTVLSGWLGDESRFRERRFDQEGEYQKIQRLLGKTIKQIERDPTNDEGLLIHFEDGDKLEFGFSSSEGTFEISEGAGAQTDSD